MKAPSSEEGRGKKIHTELIFGDDFQSKDEVKIGNLEGYWTTENRMGKRSGEEEA